MLMNIYRRFFIQFVRDNPNRAPRDVALQTPSSRAEKSA
jgi:hypothetical protein